ncbi:MAG: hypothetical protein ACRCWY_05760 [Cellulosilyticaceae bacterium]
MKEPKHIPENKMNTILGHTYIQNCVWVPWVVLTILIVATRLEESNKMAAWWIVALIVASNIGYIAYRVITYMLKQSKAGKV